MNGNYGDMEFVDNVATFTLKHGESKSAAGLPEGTAYTVEESGNEGYTVTKTGDVGTIAGGETAVVKFVNAMSGGDNQLQHQIRPRIIMAVEVMVVTAVEVVLAEKVFDHNRVWSGSRTDRTGYTG